MEHIDLHIESLIFASETPVRIGDIQEAILLSHNEKLGASLIEESVTRLMDKYENGPFSFRIQKIDGGYQFLTKELFHPVLESHLKQQNKKKLTRAALETLSIIAYKQPVTKPEIEQIRGVNCDYTIQKLLEKEYISIKGRADKPGAPIIYETSEKFMKHFGLSGISELPKLKEIKPRQTEIGEPAPVEEHKPEANL